MIATSLNMDAHKVSNSTCQLNLLVIFIFVTIQFVKQKANCIEIVPGYTIQWRYKNK